MQLQFLPEHFVEPVHLFSEVLNSYRPVCIKTKRVPLTMFYEDLASEPITLAGNDGEQAGALMQNAEKNGQQTLERITRAAILRLLADPTPHDATILFTDAELKQLAASLAAANASADMLGRSRIHRIAARESGIEKFAEWRGPFVGERGGVYWLPAGANDTPEVREYSREKPIASKVAVEKRIKSVNESASKIPFVVAEDNPKDEGHFRDINNIKQLMTTDEIEDINKKLEAYRDDSDTDETISRYERELYRDFYDEHERESRFSVGSSDLKPDTWVKKKGVSYYRFTTSSGKDYNCCCFRQNLHGGESSVHQLRRF